MVFLFYIYSYIYIYIYTDTNQIALLYSLACAGNDDTYQCVCAGNCVIHIRTNRAMCALYKKILDLLYEESISGESNGRASL